ncbi:MAG: dual specificity protein phosphatase family protein [Rubrivivax sp.]|nr:dual specificity protein phosphatase family protein [Rubrivivax sp.]MBK7263078.1 dual specificity protein phosphatase family protein [Rubrivivax sp.]MBK8526994.1 dual specificity protein phosphatase family protein [Rubrivivax sp.]
MSFRALALPAPGLGQVWLSAMPGRFESWASFQIEAQARAVQHVLCLNPMFEVESLSPPYAQAIGAGILPFRWTHLPMQDFGLAARVEAFRDAIDEVATSVRAGDAVLLHCAAGIGRTGTAAACLLKRLGASSTEALQCVRDAGSNPESALQRGLIDHF